MSLKSRGVATDREEERGSRDVTGKVKEWGWVGWWRTLTQERPENQSSRVFSPRPRASPLCGPQHPSLPPWPSWQMELLIAFEIIGVTLHTREFQAQLQLST